MCTHYLSRSSPTFIRSVAETLIDLPPTACWMFHPNIKYVLFMLYYHHQLVIYKHILKSVQPEGFQIRNCESQLRQHCWYIVYEDDCNITNRKKITKTC